MSTFKQVYVFTLLAQALNQATLDTWVPGGQPYYVPLSATSLSGVMALNWKAGNDGTHFADHYYLIPDVEPSQTTPIRELLATPGVESSTSIYDPTNDATVYLTWIEDVAAPAKAQTIAQLTGLTCVVDSVEPYQCADATLTTILVRFRVDAASRSIYLEDVYRIYQYQEAGSPLTQQVAPETQPAPTASSYVTDTSGIVDVLQDIALQDQEVSINQGAAAWSIKGKVLTP